MKKERVDVLLVERGLAESSTKAQALILAGLVVAGDQRVDKPGARLPVEIELRLKGEALPYVSPPASSHSHRRRHSSSCPSRRAPQLRTAPLSPRHLCAH